MRTVRVNCPLTVACLVVKKKNAIMRYIHKRHRFSMEWLPVDCAHHETMVQQTHSSRSRTITYVYLANSLGENLVPKSPNEVETL